MTCYSTPVNVAYIPINHGDDNDVGEAETLRLLFLLQNTKWVRRTGIQSSRAQSLGENFSTAGDIHTECPPALLPRWRNEAENDVSHQLNGQRSWLFIVHLPCNSLSVGLQRGAVQVALTLNPLGCWVCDLLKIVQQSLMRASLTAFTSSIKTAASAFFLPYQFCHIFVSSFWALHQLHLLPASPSSPVSCHCRKRCWFPYATASQEAKHKWLTLNYLDNSHDLPSSYLLFCSLIFFVLQNCQCKPHPAGTTAAKQSWQVASMCRAGGGLGERSSTCRIDPCIWNP